MTLTAALVLTTLTAIPVVAGLLYRHITRSHP